MQTTYHTYSPLFTTVYDEPEPVGKFGRGTHYSILRTAQFTDKYNNPKRTAEILDFCVVWDEDHDTRIITVIEKLYLQGLLAPVRFIGERKGTMTVLLDHHFCQNVEALKTFSDYFSSLGQVHDDYWYCEVDAIDFDNMSNGFSYLIQATPEKTSVYLANIHNLWQLGLKKWTSNNLR